MLAPCPKTTLEMLDKPGEVGGSRKFVGRQKEIGSQLREKWVVRTEVARCH